MSDNREINTSGAAIKAKKRKIAHEAIAAYIFVSIPLIGYLFFNVFPIAISFCMQFNSMTGLDLSTMKWNNFENFKRVFTDNMFYKSIGVTFLLSLSQLISLALALFISVMIHNKPFGHKVFQVIYFVPYICSSVAVSLMWMWMFDVDTGIINTVLEMIGGSGARVDWFGSTAAYPIMIIVAIVWQAPGYGIVMYRATLNQVNPSLYEAADVDGAGIWTKFIKITMPAIAPTTFYLLMTGIIAGLQIFDIAKIFAGTSWLGTSGPENSGLTTVLYIYNTFHDYGELPRASVMSWALFVVIFIVSMINFRFKKKWVDD